MEDINTAAGDEVVGKPSKMKKDTYSIILITVESISFTIMYSKQQFSNYINIYLYTQ